MSQLRHHHITNSSHSINAIGHMSQLHPCRVLGCYRLTWVVFCLLLLQEEQQLLAHAKRKKDTAQPANPVQVRQ
jgi:hypothetical protein